MQVTATDIEGCFIVEPRVFHDSRGYFFESFNTETFEKITGIQPQFVQDNISVSSRGVIRGLHYQCQGFAQAKLVQVLKGKILDVALDIRPNSATYGKHIQVELSQQNKRQLYIPRGFAHGFIALEPETMVSYKCDNFYNKDSEGGILYNDPSLDINWGLSPEHFIISEKDTQLPTFDQARKIW